MLKGVADGRDYIFEGSGEVIWDFLFDAAGIRKRDGVHSLA